MRCTYNKTLRNNFNGTLCALTLPLLPHVFFSLDTTIVCHMHIRNSTHRGPGYRNQWTMTKREMFHASNGDLVDRSFRCSLNTAEGLRELQISWKRQINPADIFANWGKPKMNDDPNILC